MNRYRTRAVRIFIGLASIVPSHRTAATQQPAPTAASAQPASAQPTPQPPAPQAAAPTPQASTPPAPASAPATAPAVPPSTVDVRTFGAKGDGTTDDTAAFRAALASVAAKGGVVSVPVGDYLIKTHLEVPANVTVEGVWKSPTAKTQRSGTTLLAVEGAGAEAGPAFITLAAGATLKGVSVFYPDQKPEKPVMYPWCVAAAGENVAVIDCLLVNPYQGLDLAGKPSGRYYVRNLYGQPLRRGLSVDKCFDVGRIENVHFGPFWNWDEKTGIQTWQQQNGEAFIFARTDWEYVTNTFCFGYGVGYRLTKSADGSMNGNLDGIGADASHHAVVIDATQGPSLLISRGQFVSFTGDKPAHVIVAEAHAGVVQFQNCAFWGLANQVARIAGTGTVSFSNCNFADWAAATPAIDLSGGDLLLNGCVFQKPFPQAVLQNKAQSAIFTANRLAGPLTIDNPAKANLQAGLNVEKKPAAP